MDHALFPVIRFRAALARHGDPVWAAGESVDTAGKAVALSGLTVLVSRRRRLRHEDEDTARVHAVSRPVQGSDGDLLLPLGGGPGRRACLLPGERLA
ncbi:MMPL family transporter [Streptomyces sp. NPDC048411]|uniref:MMPL family transporter n=1 Tax=Streptomyces sp. NPDC048411 TaxID=3157206 RepID=UPI003454D1CB